MSTKDNGLTLEGLAQRLGTLERENTELRSKVATLEHSGTPSTEDGKPHASEWSASDGQVSRKWLLSKAGAATVGAVAAGALMLGDTRQAKANHYPTQLIQANRVDAHEVYTGSIITDSIIVQRGPMLSIRTDDTRPAGEGRNNGRGPGLLGKNYSVAGGTGVLGEGAVGVVGKSGVNGNGAVAGVHTGTTGTGVVGEGKGTGDFGAGVLGRNPSGYGVLGQGENGVKGQGKSIGVRGESSGTAGYGVVGEGKGAAYSGVMGRSDSGSGIRGESTSGYGGHFEGGKAQLKLKPASRAGTPGLLTHHTEGEIYMDSASNLFVCVASSNDEAAAKWRKVTTTAV